MQFTIKAAPFGAALLNVLPHAESDGTRPVLATVRVTLADDGTIVLDATDRYSIGEQTIPFDPKVLADGFTPGQVLVPTSLVKEVAKQAKAAKLGFLNVTVAGDRITVEHPGGAVTGLATIGDYPKTASLWPAPDARGDVDRVGFGANNLAKFVKLVQADLRPVKNPAIEITFVTAVKPATVVVTQLEHFRALVMPVRLSEPVAKAEVTVEAAA